MPIEVEWIMPWGGEERAQRIREEIAKLGTRRARRPARQPVEPSPEEREARAERREQHAIEAATHRLRMLGLEGNEHLLNREIAAYRRIFARE